VITPAWAAVFFLAQRLKALAEWRRSRSRSPKQEQPALAYPDRQRRFDRARSHAPKVVLPAGAQLFVSGAARFEQLSRNHPLGAYLTVIGTFAAPRRRCSARRTGAEPGRAAGGGEPRLRHAAACGAVARRDPQWHADLAGICDQLRHSGQWRIESDAGRAAAFRPRCLEALAGAC